MPFLVFLRAYLGTSEVIVTIMMNYIVLYVGNAFIHHFPKEIMQSTDSSIRVSANATYQTPWLAELTGNSRMNIGIFFAIIAVAVIWFLLKKTTLGFEIRAVGLNPNASEYAGISAKRTIILSMIISGALAGAWWSSRRTWYLPKRIRSRFIIGSLDLMVWR